MQESTIGEQDRMRAGRSFGRLRRMVVLVGMMGSGKTSVGRALSVRLAAPFLDSDAEIEAAADASISEIFARDGEAFFRERESEVLERLLKGPPAVLSTGGGIFLRPRNRELIAARAVSVWLDADLDTLWDRVRHKDTRPLLRNPDPRATLGRIHDERAPLYGLADLRVRAEPSFSVEQTAAQVIEALAARQGIIKGTS